MHLGDGFIAVEPTFPESLKKALTYWHRQLEWDDRTRTRVTSGTYRALYTTKTILDSQNRVITTLHTLPGFAKRIANLLQNEGYETSFIDERTPFPKPDLDRAMENMREYQLEAVYNAVLSGGGILSHPTAWGKTHLIKAIINAFPHDQLIYRNTPLSVVVAADMDVCRKNYNDLKKMFYRQREVGLVMTGEKEFSDDIQVITFDSLHHINPAEIGILIVDECVSGNTLITTELGNVRIDEAEQLGCKYVLTSCGPRDIFKRITRYYKQGIRGTIKIITNKRILICTPEHKIMTEKGWQQAASLIVSNKIKVSGLNGIMIWLQQHHYANVAAVRKLIVNTACRLRSYVKTEWLHLSTTITKQTTRDVNRGGTLNLIKQSLVNWWVQFWGMRVYRYPILMPKFQDYRGTTGLNNVNGLNTRLITSTKIYDLNIKSASIWDGVKSHVTPIHPRIQNLLDYINLHIRIIRKQLVLGYLICLLMKVLHGGFVMMVQGIHHIVICIHKDLVNMNKFLYRIGLRISIILYSFFKEIKNENYGFYAVDWQTGCGLKKLLRRLFQNVCVTNYEIVLNIIDSTPVEVYDIEVEDTHCFYANGILVHNCHTAGTEKRTDLILAADKAMRWGVSATPMGRFDGGDLLTEGLFGPIVHQSSYKEGVEVGALVPIDVCWLKCPEPSIGLQKYFNYKRRNKKIDYGIELNKNLSKNVMDLIGKIPDKLQTMCIMPHLQQMNELRMLNKDIKIAHGDTSDDSIKEARYHELYGVSKKERQAIYDQMADGTIRKILSTYVYKQGVNFPHLTIIVCPGGGGSAIVAGQIPGRASRTGVAGKDKAYIVDYIHDWDTYEVDGKNKPGPLLHDDLSRKKVYKSLGFTQTDYNSIDDLPFLKEVDAK